MEILNKTEIINMNVVLVTLVIIAALCMLFEVILLTGDIDLGGYLAVVGFMIMVNVLIFCDFEGVPTSRYKYEVILDESYSATELYENYDVVEQRGKIWVIEDKEE